MTSLIFIIINIEWLVILPYVSSNFITSKLYKTLQILILGTMTLLKRIIIIMTMTIMISTAIFQNVTEK